MVTLAEDATDPLNGGGSGVVPQHSTAPSMSTTQYVPSAAAVMCTQPPVDGRALLMASLPQHSTVKLGRMPHPEADAAAIFRNGTSTGAACAPMHWGVPYVSSVHQ